MADSASTTVLPGVVDHHVHLGLVDHAALADGPVVEVHDLGWDPAEALGLRARPPRGVTVRVAGPFHTAPGGYPSGRAWAPPAAVRELRSVADARQAVADAVAASYDVVKVALHSGMPLLADDVLAALVRHAHDVSLPVAVHAEGPGQVARAVAAGADVLAHAPWTERVPDEVLRQGRHMTWCSTLAIHHGADRATAIDNVRRFRTAGGRVVYGTDMGNGPTPVGVNPAELLALGEAGLEGDDLLLALTGVPAGRPEGAPAERLLVSPHPRPSTASEAVAWLADCRRPATVPPEERHADR